MSKKARIQLDDGRIALIEVPDDATPEDAKRFIDEHLKANPIPAQGAPAAAPAAPAAKPPSPYGQFMLDTVGRKGIVGDVAEGIGKTALGAVSGFGSMAAGGLNALAQRVMGRQGTAAEDVATVTDPVHQNLIGKQTNTGKLIEGGLGLIPKGLDYVGGGLGNVATDAAAEMGASPEIAGALGAGIKTGVTLGGPVLLAKTAGKAQKAAQTSEQFQLAKEKFLASPKIERLRNFKMDGFVASPSAAKKSVMNDIEGSISPKANLEAITSGKNQQRTNDLVRKDLDLPETTVLDMDALRSVRDREYVHYKKVMDADLGKVEQVTQPSFITEGNTIPTTSIRNKGVTLQPEVRSKLDALASEYTKFNEVNKSVRSPSISSVLEDARRIERTPEATIDFVRKLRASATDEFKKANIGTGKPQMLESAKAKIDIANLMEENLGLNLAQAEAQGLVAKGTLARFKKARETIAKTYNVERALNNTGDVSAKILAQEMKKSPLSGNLRKIADYYGQFPRDMKSLKGEGNPMWSRLDILFAAGETAAGNPGVGALVLGSKAVLPKVQAHEWYQKHLVNPPSYNVGMTKSGLRALTQPGAVPFMLPQPEPKQ